jgi:tRNA pseudouridine38-40 synthase
VSSCRYLFCISYDGYAFSGSQKQPNKITVYGLIESSLKKLFKQSLVCIPCGRTDAGVHAEVSYFHCDFPFVFEPSQVISSLNVVLIPRGILIKSIHAVSNDFHALSSASSRTYQYFFTAHRHLPNYLLHSVSLLDRQLRFIPTDEELSFLFKGQRNFFTLSNRGSSSKSTIRHIQSISIFDKDYDSLFCSSVKIYSFEISANGFLYKMVRHIVGILLHSMVNFTNMSRLFDYLMVNRPIAYSLAPVQGLHLKDVNYNNDTKVVTT